MEIKKVLVVDDDDFYRNLMIESCQKKGTFAVFKGARSGEEALENYKNLGGFDLVISDMVMSVLGGIDLAKEILSINSEQSFLFVSSDPRYGMIVESFDKKTREKMLLIGKPFTFDMFEKKLNELGF
ncbi:MAG: response regulator [bacterium]